MIASVVEVCCAELQAIVAGLTLPRDFFRGVVLRFGKSAACEIVVPRVGATATSSISVCAGGLASGVGNRTDSRIARCEAMVWSAQSGLIVCRLDEGELASLSALDVVLRRGCAFSIFGPFFAFIPRSRRIVQFGHGLSE